MDPDTVAAYERYVMAPAKLAESGPEAVREEQQKAIESLTQGTLCYFHLYFIDLAKHKDFDELTADEKALYKKFESKFARSMEFLEVETAFHVIRRVEKLPGQIDEKTSSEDIDAYVDVMDYIDTQINTHVPPSSHSKPDFMTLQAQREGASSQSEEEEPESKLECFVYDNCIDK